MPLNNTSTNLQFFTTSVPTATLNIPVFLPENHTNHHAEDCHYHYATTTTPPYYKSRYYHHDQQTVSPSFVLGLPYHLLPQTMMEEPFVRDHKAMITPAPSPGSLNNRKPHPRKNRLAKSTRRNNKIRRMKLMCYQMLHILFRAPTAAQQQPTYNYK